MQLSDRVIFANSKNMYALMNAGTSLTKVMTTRMTKSSSFVVAYIVDYSR